MEIDEIEKEQFKILEIAYAKHQDGTREMAEHELVMYNHLKKKFG